MAKTVAILKGGWNGEREVSLTSGHDIEEALKSAGYKTYAIDVRRDVGVLVEALTPKPDVVFNALHGEWGEDGSIQAILDMMAIPYTHSGLLASAVAMDKPIAKQIFKNANLQTPKGFEIDISEALDQTRIPKPFIIKPSNQGSTLGTYIVQEGSIPNIDVANWPYHPMVMIEEFIEGKELSVAVMGDKALGVLELRAKSGFYDYTAKYTDGMTDHIMPADVPQNIYEKAMDIALKAHQVLGCTGISRADIRYNPELGEQGLYLLEVNTQPGMTPLSIVPDIAKHAGYTFEDIVVWMVENAQCKK